MGTQNDGQIQNRLTARLETNRQIRDIQIARLPNDR